MVRNVLVQGAKHDRSNTTLIVGRCFLAFFKSIGLLTPSVRYETSHTTNLEPILAFRPSRPGIFYNVLLSILWLVAQALTMPNRVFTAYPGKSSITESADQLQAILAIVATPAIVGSFCFEQESAVRVGNGLGDVQRKFRAFRISSSPRRVFLRALTISLVNLSTVVLHSVPSHVQYNRTGMTRGIVFCWLLDTLVLLVINSSLLLYCLLVVFVRAKFVEINVSLVVAPAPFKPKYGPQWREPPRRTIAATNLANHVVFVRDVYVDLLEICDAVNGAFAVPILFGITYLFFCIVNTSFYTVAVIISKEAASYVSAPVTTMICVTVPIAMLSFAVTNLRNEVTRTSRLVQNLLNSTSTKELVRELKLFSLQLLHEKPHFTACGFFDLDCSLLQGIIGAVATYMVILIQFHISST